MLLSNYRRTLDLLLVFGFFFLANSLVFAYAFWLVPTLVLLVTIAWSVLTVLSVWILIRKNLLSVFVEILKQNWIIVPFLIFSGFSILWSVNWQISLYRWLVLFSTIITGGYIGIRYDIKEIIKLLSVFGIYILFVSSIFVFFIPEIGIMNYSIIQGAWSGVYWHKNHMGLMVTFVNILFLLNLVNSWSSTDQNRFLWGSLYLYSLFFIYQTDSVAAYLTTVCLHGVLLLALAVLRFREKIQKIHYFIFFAVFLLALFILYLNLDVFFAIFNRKTNLTGRVPLWMYLFAAYINKRPLLGYGFNAFWYIKSHQVATQQAARYVDPIIIADNGFIDILVNTGYIGLILFLIFYLGMWVISVKYASQAKDLFGFFPIILMTYTFLANISWSLLFENEGFFMLIMICILFSISRSTPPNRFRMIENKAT